MKYVKACYIIRVLGSIRETEPIEIYTFIIGINYGHGEPHGYEEPQEVPQSAISKLEYAESQWYNSVRVQRPEN